MSAFFVIPSAVEESLIFLAEKWQEMSRLSLDMTKWGAPTESRLTKSALATNFGRRRSAEPSHTASSINADNASANDSKVASLVSGP